MSYAPIDVASLNRAPNSRDNSLLSSNSSSIKNSRQKINGHNHRYADTHQHLIIVHSHLCWDWVWQRPQQFLSRLSQKHKILFVETIAPDPELAAPLARIRNVPEYPRITILRMQFPQWRWHDGNHIDLER